MVLLDYSQQTLLVGKAVLIVILGIFVGFILKSILRRYIDSIFLKRVFSRDASVYETSSVINKVFTEVLQWVVIIYTLDYSLTLLNFNFLGGGIEYLTANLPEIVWFILIIVAGILISKLVTSKIKEQDIENRNEIISISELVILSAFFLTALEFIGIKATALLELYQVILYILGVIIVILIINPKLIKGQKKEKK